MEVAEAKSFFKKLPLIVRKCLTFEGIVLAGGAVRAFIEKREIRDFDLFCFDSNSRDKVLRLLEQEGISTGEQGGTKKFQVSSLEIEVILEIFSSARSILESFDFRCCQVGLYQGCLISIPGALTDISEKKLIYCGTKFPLHTWRDRVPKYVNRYHYAISESEILQILKDLPEKE